MSDKKTLIRMIKRMEDKLKELMPPAEYERFIVTCSRDTFREEVEEMTDSPFKQFILDNFDQITR